MEATKIAGWEIAVESRWAARSVSLGVGVGVGVGVDVDVDEDVDVDAARRLCHRLCSSLTFRPIGDSIEEVEIQDFRGLLEQRWGSGEGTGHAKRLGTLAREEECCGGIKVCSKGRRRETRFRQSSKRGCGEGLGRGEGGQ